MQIFLAKDSSGRVISLKQRPLPHDTKHSKQTDIHAPGGIRTHNLKRKRPQMHALDGVATVIGILIICIDNIGYQNMV